MKRQPGWLDVYPRYWDETRETRDAEQRRDFILDRVREQVRTVYERFPFYRRLYDSCGLEPQDVRTWEDFSKVPVVTKEMLRDDQAAHPPFGSYSSGGTSDIARVFASSGTTGTPTVYAISREDWRRADHAQAMATWAMGVRPDDMVHLVFPFTMFVGGWAVLQGTSQIGAANFAAGALDSRKQLDMMKQLGPTVIAGTPSYCLHLAEVAKEEGVDLRELPVHTLIVGGEPGGSLSGVRWALQQVYGDVAVVDTGNTSECFPTQMNSSCHEGNGVHVFEDEVFLEVVAPDDPTQPVPDGHRGATVYTTLWRESQPMIRFWAGDETYLTREPCACGRTYPRLPEGLVGRVDDMLLVRGANIYPSAVDDALRRVPGMGAEYRIEVFKQGAMDEIRVRAEYDPRWWAAQSNPGQAKETLIGSMDAALRRSIGIRCPVHLVEPGTLEVQMFKARRVLDNRSTPDAPVAQPSH